VGETQPSYKLLDPVSKRIVRDGQPYRPLHPISPEDSKPFTVLMQGEFSIQGFRNRDVRAWMEPSAEQDAMTQRKASARTTRRLRLLRAHGLIRKVPGTRYYRVTGKGQLVMSTSLTFRSDEYSALKAA